MMGLYNKGDIVIGIGAGYDSEMEEYIKITGMAGIIKHKYFKGNCYEVYFNDGNWVAVDGINIRPHNSENIILMPFSQ